MQTSIQKWGNSLALRIPASLSKQLHLSEGSLEGSLVNIEIAQGKIVINAPKYNLKDMLEAITKDNLHSSLLDDSKRGKEEW